MKCPKEVCKELTRIFSTPSLWFSHLAFKIFCSQFLTESHLLRKTGSFFPHCAEIFFLIWSTVQWLRKCYRGLNEAFTAFTTALQNGLKNLKSKSSFGVNCFSCRIYRIGSDIYCFITFAWFYFWFALSICVKHRT